MKKIIKLASLTLLMSTAFSLSSCAKESNLTRACIYKTVDGMNLYLTAIAKGNISSNYVYLGDADANRSLDSQDKLKAYCDQIKEKADKQRPNCDVAYFPISNDKEVGMLKTFFKEQDAAIRSETNKFKIVYIDSYVDSTAELTNLKPTGVWIGRIGWINNSGTSKKFISGLAKTAQYRVSEMIKYTEKGDVIKKTTNDAYEMAYRDFADEKWNTFEEMYNFIETKLKNRQLPDYMFNDKNDKIVNYKSIYEYCALFALQNGGAFPKEAVEIFKHSSSKDTTKPFISNETAINLFGETKNLGKDTEGDKPITQAGEKILTDLADTLGINRENKINTDLMRYGIYQTSHPTSSSGNMKQVILISSICGGVVLIILVLLIIRRVKTGRKLFNIKKALDIDIPLDDPRMIAKRNVAADLKEMRKALGMSLEDAAYLMRIKVPFLEKEIESGAIMVPKKFQARFISCYHLTNDYFDKAYDFKNK